MTPTADHDCRCCGQTYDATTEWRCPACAFPWRGFPPIKASEACPYCGEGNCPGALYHGNCNRNGE